MKTLFELQYEKLIISTIADRSCSSIERAALFMEFYEYGTQYYEELCDALFLLSTGESDGSLWLTPAGEPYISVVKQQEGDRELCCSDTLPNFKSDLTEQLDFVFRRFKESQSVSKIRVNLA